MRSVRIIFLGIMGMLLVLPGAQMIFGFVDIPALQEYRRLATFPDLTKVFTEPHARLAPSINKWFDDNLGFRPILTRVNNQVDYSLFSYSRSAAIGTDGWFFDNAWLLDKVRQERLGEAIQDEAEKKIVAIAHYLAQRNMKLVVVTIPISATVYPEFLPASAPRVPHPSQFEKFNAFLKGRADLLVVDGMDVLMPHKAEGLFFKTDVHYNPVGAYLIAKALVQTITLAEGRTDDPWDRGMPFVTFRDWNGGSIGRYLSVFNSPVETYSGNDIASSFDQRHPPPGQSVVNGTPPIESIYHNDPSRTDRLPPVALFGNSFSDWFSGLGMYECFKTLYRIRGNGNELGEAMRHAPDDTRYFVFQLIEPFFDGFTYAEIPTMAATSNALPIGMRRQ